MYNNLLKRSMILVIMVLFLAPTGTGLARGVTDGKSLNATSQIANREILANDNGSKFVSCLDGIDQSQEQSGNFYKIYGNNWYAQSFIPAMGKCTKIELLIGCIYESNWLIELLSNLAKVFPFLESIVSYLEDKLLNLPDWLFISLCDSQDGLPGKRIASTSIDIHDLSKNYEWVTFDLPDEYVRAGREYFIVCHTTHGGDESNCYKWGYGTSNPYGAGMAYSSSDSGDSWDAEPNFDLCFRTYGEYTGEEPDGVTERWAVLFTTWPDEPGVSLNNARDCLIHHGWEEDHIKRIFEATSYDVQSAISWVDSVDDQDDIFLIYSSTHGGNGGISLEDKYLYYVELDEWLDNCGASIFYSISACHCGSAIPILGQKGRVIMTACKANESGATAWFTFFLYYEYDIVSGSGYIGAPSPNGAFCRGDCDLNGDGWISAEEAFPYVKEWVEKVNNEWWKPEWPLHPQMYDGYDGELLITQVEG